ncbi:thiamine phosphate synthase [Thiofilum flexile]|uniref:thiamine phosphate synthase n=1 Tax=Thiofilum flexile TaxID=125627 RepID=UPI00037F8696|nr:thiamine phosphate synthase [Thiofilum flexile]
MHTPRQAFARCTHPHLGLYPIVDRAQWLERLLPLGIRTIQVRIKDLTGEALKQELATSVQLAQQYQAQLFINDYWELALELGAYGVHLGQKDIETADLIKLQQAGIRLGLSSHCEDEVQRALSLQPSYIATGPVYPTQTKIMPWQPQTLEGVRHWRKKIPYPLVAIGGINAERLPTVWETGVDGVAVLSVITQAPNPEQVTRELLALSPALS